MEHMLKKYELLCTLNQRKDNPQNSEVEGQGANSILPF